MEEERNDILEDLQEEMEDIKVETDSETETEQDIVQSPDYKGEVLQIVQSNESPRSLKEKLENYHENDIAQVLSALTETERKKLYRILDTDMLSAVFEYTEEEDAGRYLQEMDMRKAAAVLMRLESDTAVQVLRSIEKEKRSVLIDLMDADTRKDIALIASFDEDEIGSRMTTNCIIIRENLTVKQAMHELVEQAGRNDNISTIFVEDEENAFYGAIDLKELIIARDGSRLDDLILTSFPYVYGHESIDDCIEKLKDYSENSIPVLDNNNRIIGVITSQSIIEVVDEEMGEDYARLAGLTAEEDLEEPLLASMKKRLPWLLILLGLGMVVSTVVGTFEQVVSQLPLIMAFQSLILDMAGNVGTQSLAVTIRVLMDENLSFRQKIGLVGKEMRVGFCNGLLLGVISFVFLGLYIFLIKGKTPLFAFAVSGCICISLMVAMLISSALGTLIPMFFKKVGVDPAVASGPLITTINDLVAVVTYYGMSWILLLQVLQLAG